MQTEKFKNETDLEYKIRLCLAKRRHEIDLDWIEIRDLLGLEITPDQLRKVAVGYDEYDMCLKCSDMNHTKILSVSDFHVPFQLDKELLSDYAGKIDILQLNGDLVDMQAISRYPKTYRVSPMEEVILGRAYFIELIEYLKPKKVVVTYGNHDNRYQQYLAKNLDSDILELQPENVLELMIEDGFRHYNKKDHTKTWYAPLQEIMEDVEIEYVHNWHCQIGDVIFCHPTAFSSGLLKTAEKAMLWFRNEGYDFKKLVMAHTHRSGQYTIGNTTIYEQGCFCDVKRNNYNDGKLINSQKEGFLYLVQDKDGNTIDKYTKLVVLN